MKIDIKKNSLPLFIICFGIGVALSLMRASYVADSGLMPWLRSLAMNVTYAEIIGFSNLILCNLLPKPGRIKSNLWHQIFLAGEFTVASLLGTFIAMWATSWMMDEKIPEVALVQFVLMIVSFSLLATYGTYFYFKLKDRLETTAVQLKERELHAERMEKLKVAAEVSALQSRIQPHFLFNTLNSIAALIREDPAAAEATTEKLAELFRHALESNRRQYISLGEEIAIIEHYLEIEKLRLGDRLRYRIEIVEGLRDLQVPGLLIQPLVENSIKHGIAPLEKGGELLVSVQESGKACVIIVQDSGAGFAHEQGGNGYGLQNIRERLDALYGATAQFDLRSGVGNGTRVEITLPIKQAHNE